MSDRVFDRYRARIGYHGGTYKDSVKAQAVGLKEAIFTETVMWKTVYIDSEPHDARIHKDVSDTVKNGAGNYKIELRTGDLVCPGTYILMENENTGEMDVWLIMSTSDDILFPLHQIKKCSRTIKWVDEMGKVCERWICFNDSYTMGDAVKTYDNTTRIPDSTMAIYLPYDRDTIKLRFDTRFLIDVPGIEEPNAWRVVNRNAVSRVYNGHGIILLTLGRDQFNHETDSAELMVADYYKEPQRTEVKEPEINAVSAVLSYKGQPKIVAGAPSKMFELQFFDRNSNKIIGLEPNYEVLVVPELQQFFRYEKTTDGKLSVAVEFNENVINSKFKIIGYCNDGSIRTELLLKVVSGV